MIRIEHVTKEYRSKQGVVRAVDDVSLTIEKGSIYGIIGFSGAGKSTLVRLLNGLEDTTSGKIILDDKVITDLKRKELLEARKKISMIFQHFNLLWSRTVFENIAFPLEVAGIPKKERQERVTELIRLVGLNGRENSYPAQLSGGQKQRVGIARALANHPDVLLCDEATSALDPKTTNDILKLLVDINQKLGLTIVMITHEMEVVRKICHRVAVMEAGKVVEEGLVGEVFRNPQQEITKQFIGADRHDEEIDEIIAQLQPLTAKGIFLRVQYFGDTTAHGLISEMIQKYQVTISIIQGNVQATHEGPIGYLLIFVEAEEERVQLVSEELRTHGVGVEVV